MKPILFSAPMARAVLNAKPGVWPAEPIDEVKPFKWQTRRVIKPQPQAVTKSESSRYKGGAVLIDSGTERRGPHYSAGDILWARETHWVNGKWFSYISENGTYGREFVEFTDDNARVLFDDPKDETLSYLKRPSIFMPRKAARLFLQVKSVRAERLQDISEWDVKAEGVNVPPLPTCADPSLKRRCEFASLWDTLNAKRGYGWDSDPWVWVIEFMRVKRGGTQ